MKSLKLIVALASLLSAQAVSAAPTYIACMFKTGMGEDWPVLLIADEAKSQMTVKDQGVDKEYVVRARYSPETVLFVAGFMTYQIDRLTLVTKRTFDDPSEAQSVQCALQPAPERAF